MYSPQKFHESCTKLSTETTPPGRSIGQNNRAITPSHLTTNPVTTTALITSRRCHSPVIDPPLPSPLVKQVVIAAAEVVNDGASMSETSKAKSIVFEDVEESAKEQREGKAPMVEEIVPPPKKLEKQLRVRKSWIRGSP
ncbi:hypothetical protein Tco_1430075 [Tanacetum coccineum]